MIYYNGDVIEKVFAWEVFGISPVTDPGWRVDSACPTRTGRGGAFPWTVDWDRPDGGGVGGGASKQKYLSSREGVLDGHLKSRCRQVIGAAINQWGSDATESESSW